MKSVVFLRISVTFCVDSAIFQPKRVQICKFPKSGMFRGIRLEFHQRHWRDTVGLDPENGFESGISTNPSIIRALRGSGQWDLRFSFYDSEAPRYRQLTGSSTSTSTKAGTCSATTAAPAWSSIETTTRLLMGKYKCTRCFARIS